MAFQWDGYALDVASRRVFGPEGYVHMEPGVFDVLAFLVEHRDRVVTKAEILDAVWGDRFVSESALSTRIKQVRQALGDDGRTQKYVRSIHGRGYQFVGEIDPTAVGAAGREPSGSDDGGLSTPDATPLQLALDIAVDTEFPFVGRIEELDACRAMLERGRASNSQIFIGGAPGAGKSRLAIELIEEASAAGALVCAGRCETGAASGLQAIRDAFAQLAAVHPTRVPGWAEGVEGPLLSLMPSLVNLVRGDPVPVDAYAGIDVFMAVFDRVVADGPLVLLVDDLQWSDDPTRTFLGRLHRRLRGRAFTTVSTFRSGRGELPQAVHQWLQQQRRSPDVADLALGALGDGDARHLIAAVVGDDSTDDDAHADLLAVTGGHCLFLTESLREVQLGQGDPDQQTSDSVIELIAARLERQPEPVQQIVRAGALLGTEFPFLTAATAAELEPVDALAAVESAIEAELLHETSSSARFRFSHQLVPQAVAESLSKAQRATLHRSCATALSEEGADDAEVAFHLLGAVPLISSEEAVAAARAASTKAQEAKQFDLAIRLLEQVVASEPEPRVLAESLLAIGQVLNEKGMPGEAIPVLDRLFDIARTNGWTDLFVAAALAHWSQSPYRKPRDRATVALLEEALELVGDGPSIERAHLLAKTAVFNVFTDRLSEKDEATAQALAIAEEVGAEPTDLLTLLEARHIVFSCPAGVDELDLLDPRIEEIRVAINDYFKDAAAPETAALMKARGAELRRVTAGDADRIAAQPIAEWRDLTIRSSLAAFEGDVETARDLCDRSAEIGEAFWGESAYSLQGYGHFFFDLISDQWERSVELMDLLVAFDGSPVFLPSLALASLRTGDTDKAEQTIEQIRPSGWMGFGEHILGGNALVAAAELALALDDDTLAKAAEAALTPYSHLMLGVPWVALSLAAADPLARLADRRGDGDAALAYRATAEAVYRDLQAPALVERMS